MITLASGIRNLEYTHNQELANPGNHRVMSSSNQARFGKSKSCQTNLMFHNETADLKVSCASCSLETAKLQTGKLKITSMHVMKRIRLCL